MFNMRKSSRKLIHKSKILSKILNSINRKFQLRLLSFYKDKNVVDVIKSIHNSGVAALFPFEAFHVYSIVRSQSKLEGDMAEVGVYQGGSAKLICETKGKNTLHLFDTFEGLPEVSDIDTTFGEKTWTTGQFNNTSLESVKNYLRNYPNVHLYKGTFLDTATNIIEKKFSFVHLDVDLYQSTKDCLEFFYPRLVIGGVILTHDYHSDGVNRAFKEFTENRNVHLIELIGPQCMIIKINSHS